MKLHGRRGFSLLEVMIVTAIVGFLAAALYAVLSSAGTTYANMSNLGDAQERARRSMDEMAKELRLADLNSLIIPVAKDSVTFRVPVSYNATTKTVTWSTDITYKLELSAVDANHSNTATSTPADDWRIVRLEGPVATPTKTQRLTDYVKTGGLQFTRTNENIVIALTFLSVDERNKIIETTLQSSVTVRNSN